MVHRFVIICLLENKRNGIIKFTFGGFLEQLSIRIIAEKKYFETTIIFGNVQCRRFHPISGLKPTTIRKVYKICNVSWKFIKLLIKLK